MEKWDVYDKEGHLTGKTKTRIDNFRTGEYHLSTSLWIANHNGKLLIQKRASSKRVHPNIWGITGGSVISGETSKQGCIREAFEEIGIKVKEDSLIFLQRYLGKDTIFDDYLLIQDFFIENAVINSQEVSMLKWASFDEIKELYFLGLFLFGDFNELEKIIVCIEIQLPISATGYCRNTCLHNHPTKRIHR